jgi:hypothetical protein
MAAGRGSISCGARPTTSSRYFHCGVALIEWLVGSDSDGCVDVDAAG